MQFGIDGVAVIAVDFENQVSFDPITAQTSHAVVFASVHQFFGKEAGEVADAADDVAREEIVGITHM